MLTLECGLCKNSRYVKDMKAIILLDGFNISKGNVCNTCFFKLLALFRKGKLQQHTKDQTLDVWGVSFE